MIGRRILVSALSLISPALLSAQIPAADIRIRVQSETQAPLGGALVAMIDVSDRVIVEQLSSSAGVASLAAPAGTYRIRVRRIGFRPFYSDPVVVPRPGELLLKVESPRVVLNTMVVNAPSQCGRINRDAQTLAILWEEISKALRASQLTASDLDHLSKALTYRRETRSSGEVISSDSTVMPVSNNRPFGAPDPLALVTIGYVRGDLVNGWEYFGPDEAVLLSNGFAATHCFRAIRDRRRTSQIGVAFEPAPKRRQSDIKGVIWLDEGTSELREVVFTYTNAGVLTEFEPGGFSRFRRMPSGAWLVSEWQLRMPRLMSTEGARSRLIRFGVIENGGRLIERETGKDSLLKDQ